MLDHDDHARGRTIAVTGTIDPRGSVGMVGGVPAKTVAAEHAGATLLLVPEDQVAAAEGEGLPVRGVATLDEALDVLDARSS